MNLTEDDVHALRQQKDLKAFIAGHLRAAQTANAHRRGQVLAYADLAAKLTEQPLNFSEPGKWTGFIPPSTVCSGALNTTPVRPALLALVHEAEQREQRRTTGAKGIAA